MHGYSIGKQKSTASLGAQTSPIPGPGLATRIALSSSLVTLMLVAIMLAASIYFVSSHIKNIYVEKAYAIANAFDHSIDAAVLSNGNGLLRERIRDSVLLSPELISVTVFKSRDSRLIAFASSSGSVDQLASAENFAAFRENRVITRDVETATGKVLRVTCR